MQLIRWTPQRNAWRMQDRMSRLFDEFFAPTLPNHEGLTLRNWTPSADLYEDDGNFVIKAELPGVDKKNIHVDVQDNVLILKGERTDDKEVKEDNFYRKEISYGSFERSFALPDGVDVEKIKADYNDGVIKITIPKPENKQPKKIAVH